MNELTVLENLDFFANIKGVLKNRVEFNKNYIIKNLGLRDYKHVQAYKLSEGNKRKLCIAQALIGCPSLLFLDEPTTGVDPISREMIVRLLKRLECTSMVLTTHRMDEA